jgi:hypothetical protein
MQGGSNIDVKRFCASRLGLLDWASGELGQWSVRREELESTRLVHGDVNADDVVEVGLQPVEIVNTTLPTFFGIFWQLTCIL